MAGNIDSENTSLLIDFSSPASKRPLDLPLIPVPSLAGQLSISPGNSNPFDIVERQTAPLDPFEFAFKNELKSSIYTKSNDDECVSVSGCSKLQKHKMLLSTSPSITSNESIQMNNVTSERDLQSCSTKCKTVSNSVVVSEADSQSQISVDMSTEEELKAVIAKRVNKCIQEVLGNNLKSQFSQSSENLKTCKSESNITSTFNNRRSLSFVMDSKNAVNNDRLHKSCAEYAHCEDLFFEQKPNFPDSTINSCDASLVSPLKKEVEEDFQFFNQNNDSVFKEANKLARTFSRIAESFCQNLDSSENDDDLLTCEPRWLYAESSEDEEEKLLKDPALNIRVSLTPTVLSCPDSRNLSAFKNRRSLDNVHVKTLPQETVQSVAMKNYTAGSKFEEIYSKNYNPITAPVSICTEKNIKFKKHVVGETKRGPMRAVMPIQSMTKDSLQLNQGSSLPNSEVSPKRKQKPEPMMETPKRNNHRLVPVASSTPNKPSSHLTHQGNLYNKRRSLDDEVKRKSCVTDVSVGTLQRSTSAKSVHSSIPTPTRLKKELSVNRPVKPQSFSSLLPSSSKMTSQTVDKQNKNVKTFVNSRALNEVKSSSPRSGRIKYAVNALSNLVIGKSKKSESQDKENRVPV